ncbi:MAG: protein kinase domain-containing protein [Omnitrophica WOR_2 bacterium]
MAQGMISNRFEMGALIGGGATGNVYMGVDTLTGEKVAIKALRRELIASKPELVERFRREGEALRRLNHPNIVKVLATVETEKQSYIVMEYVGGGSLASLITRQQKLPAGQSIAIALEIADALSRAHHLDILHRDIKPENILLAEDGTPRLTDFGLAHLGNYPALTEAGSILGTFYYLSPEACENQSLDPRADIWSFGIVLYEMLSGQLPFTGDSPFEIIYAIKNQPLPDPGWRQPEIPARLVELVRKMLMKDRVARIASARQVGAELETILKSLKPATQKPAAGVEPVKVKPPLAPMPGQPPSNKIRVMIVDDHAVVRQGLRNFIDLQDDMEVVGEGTNGAEAVELAKNLLPDVILLDLEMPRMGGVEAAAKILECSPASHILILTSFGEDDKIIPAIRAGAQGYLLKDIQPDDLIRAVRQASQGKTQLHPQIARKLMSMVSMPPIAAGSQPPGPDELTGRELEVLRMIAQGLSNREIAEKIVISEKTVKTHVSNILGKLGLEDRTQAAIWAIKHGLESKD